MKAIAFPSSPRSGAALLAPCRRVCQRWGQRLRGWSAALWQAACRRAERPQRVVPYY